MGGRGERGARDDEPGAGRRVLPVDDQHWRDLCRRVGLGAAGHRRVDVTDAAGVGHDRTVRWWRAMGFPEVPEDEPAFTELDVTIAKRLAALTGAGLVGDEAVLRLARLLGTAFCRITEAQLDLVEDLLATVPESEADTPESRPTADLAAELDESMLALLEDTLVYVWRRHLLAALGRRLATDPSAVEQAVGFADLTGFTSLSARVPSPRLAALVDAFEGIAFDVVADHDARVVKLIGDEIMYVAPTLSVAVDIALDLAVRLHAVEGMPELHCGIAVGPTVTVGGDVFGATVNLAARLTSLARPGTITVPHAAAAELADRDDLRIVHTPRTLQVAGIGRVRVDAVRPHDDATRRHARATRPSAPRGAR